MRLINKKRRKLQDMDECVFYVIKTVKTNIPISGPILQENPNNYAIGMHDKLINFAFTATLQYILIA